jgi:hypothetical protein
MRYAARTCAFRYSELRRRAQKRPVRCAVLRAGDFRPVGRSCVLAGRRAILRSRCGCPTARPDASGVIDRVDAANNPRTGKPLLRVVDYKTGSRAFNYGELRTGSY